MRLFLPALYRGRRKAVHRLLCEPRLQRCRVPAERAAVPRVPAERDGRPLLLRSALHGLPPGPAVREQVCLQQGVAAEHVRGLVRGAVQRLLRVPPAVRQLALYIAAGRQCLHPERQPVRRIHAEGRAAGVRLVLQPAVRIHDGEAVHKPVRERIRHHRHAVHQLQPGVVHVARDLWRRLIHSVRPEMSTERPADLRKHLRVFVPHEDSRRPHELVPAELRPVPVRADAWRGRGVRELLRLLFVSSRYESVHTTISVHNGAIWSF